MRKLMTVIFAMIFLIISISSVLALDLDIDMNYDYPAKAGQELTLEFTVINRESSNLTNLSFELDVDDPFDLVSSSEQQITLLPAFSSAILTYKIKVLGTAETGTEKIKLKYRRGTESWQSESFNIDIAPQTVNLGLASKTNPETIKPGENVEIQISLSSSIDVKDINIKLNLDQLPFAPISSTEKNLDKIEKNGRETLNFNVSVLSSASLQIYKIPVMLDYYDSFGQHYTKQDIVSVNVFAEPELEILIEKNELIINKESKLTLKVLNKGLGDAKFVDIRVLNGDYTIKQNENYIGKIDSDDYSSVDLQISANKQNFVLPIWLIYKDINNKEYSKQLSLNVKAYTPQEAMQAGLIKPPTWPIFLVIVVVIVIIIVVWRVLKKRKRQKHEQQ